MKEYVFLCNTINESMIDHVKEFFGDDVLIQDFGVHETGKAQWMKSIWVTKDKYKYAFAVVESPVAYDSGQKNFTLEYCNNRMEHFIDLDEVIKR